MLKRTLFLLLFPSVMYAQKEDLYLNAKNQISTQKDVYHGVSNPERSRGYAKSYDVRDAQNHLAKELNYNLTVPDSLRNAENRPYIYHAGMYRDYLIGDYRNGKPYNGFFKQPGGVLDWLLYSFYHNGVVTGQLYNDQYRTVTARPDTEEAWTTLDGINIFTGGVLTTGITFTPVAMKKGSAGGSAELVHRIKNGRTVNFVLGLFAVNYGEFIIVTPEPDGYLLQSTYSPHETRLTYTAQERKTEIRHADKKKDFTIDYMHYGLDEMAKVDLQRSFIYIRKGNELYIEQIKDKNQQTLHDNMENATNKSVFMDKMASNLYTQYPLNMPFFKKILSDEEGGMPGYFGSYTIYEGKAYGIIFNKGSLPGTFNSELYNAGKITPDKNYTLQNQTLDQMDAAFKRAAAEWKRHQKTKSAKH